MSHYHDWNEDDIADIPVSSVIAELRKRQLTPTCREVIDAAKAVCDRRYDQLPPALKAIRDREREKT